MHARDRRTWVRLLTARGLSPGRVAFVIDVKETEVMEDLASMRSLRLRRMTPPLKDLRRRPEDRPILGQAGRRVRRLVELGYTAEWIATTLALKPKTVADFLDRLEPVRKTELVRPRGRSEQKRLLVNRAAEADREAQRRLITPPAGWLNGDRFATGEAREWIQFTTAMQEARASGADILGLASRAWFAPARSHPDTAPVAPAIWAGPENPYGGSSKLTPAMIAEIITLRLQGWSTGKLAKRYGVTRATICYAFSRRTFRELQLPPPPPFVADPLARPGPPPQPRTHEDRPAAAKREARPQRFAPEAGWANGDHNATGEDREWKHFLTAKANVRDLPPDTSRVIVTPFPFEPAVWTGPTDDDETPRQRYRSKTI